MGAEGAARRVGRAMIALGVLAAFAGCAAKQTRSAAPSGFLRDYSQLHKGKEGQALLVYVNPSAHFAQYSKVLIEPVTIWHSAATSSIPTDEAQLLADELDDALRLALDEDFKVVEAPGPGVLRVRAAITEAEGSWHVDDHVAGRFDPNLRAVKAEPSSATRDFVGEAGVEAEVLDGVSGERLLAAVDRRAGARTLATKKSTWQDVHEAFAYWAERPRVRLAELRSED